MENNQGNNYQGQCNGNANDKLLTRSIFAIAVVAIAAILKHRNFLD